MATCSLSCIDTLWFLYTNTLKVVTSVQQLLHKFKETENMQKKLSATSYIYYIWNITVHIFKNDVM